MLHLFSRHSRAPRSRTRLAPPRRCTPRRPQAVWEPLEARTLLATLDISATGALTYTAGAGETNHLVIAVTHPTNMPPMYTFTDAPGITITLTTAAINAHWTSIAANEVTGPDFPVSSIAIDLSTGNDSVIVQDADAPVAMQFSNAAGNVDTVIVGGDPSKGTQAITGAVSVTNLDGATALVVDDSGNTAKAVTVSLSSTKITGLLPGTTSSGQSNPIDVSKTKLSSVTYYEGKGTTLTIASTAKAPVATTINTGVGSTSVNTTAVQTIAGPLSINARGTDTLTLGASPFGVQDLLGNVALRTSSGGAIAVLNVDDSADTTGRTTTITSTTVTGLAPNTIDYSAADLLALNVKGGEGGNSFSVTSLPDAIVTLNTGAGATIDPNIPNPNAVSVQNTTDPANANTLIVNSQSLDTITMASGTSLNVTGSLKLQSVSNSLTINTPGTGNLVTLTNSGASTGSINGGILLAGASDSARVTIDDSADTTARVVLVSEGVISGLLPVPVTYTPADVASLTLIGAGRLDTLNINANKEGPVNVVPLAGVGLGTVTIDSALPLTYENMGAVNVTNAADLPLIVESNTVVTTTGDLPLEGKAFPYLVASFLDTDVNARSSNFTAAINWGDGSPLTPGSIGSRGFVGDFPLFDVTASHTFTQDGTYKVSVTITDLGTGAVPSIIGGIPVTVTDLGSEPARVVSVAQVNLVSNGAVSAPNTDPNLVDPWGIAAGPTGPLWVGDRGAGVASRYNGSGIPQSPAITIPSSSPTGVAFNPHSGALSSVFDLVPGDLTTSAMVLFVTEDGTISGWNPKVSPTAATLKVDNSATGAVYTGLAVADNSGSTFLYAANFHSGSIEVYDQNFAPAGSFTDTSLPSGYAPYNVANIGGRLYVSFALQDATGHNPVPGLGNGFVDIFSPGGVLLQRLISNGPLNEPWGITLAPANFGQFSGDLLIANHGDGEIEAFNPATGTLVGPFLTGTGQTLTIDGLHGLGFGNGNAAGATSTLFFTAGPANGTEGLLGSLTPQVLTSSPTPVVSTASIDDAALKASVVNVSAVEGNTFTGVVSNFTDDNPFAKPGDFTATINWGDGHTSPGTVQAGNPLGSFIVVGTHTYVDETGSPEHPTPLDISVTIREKDGGARVGADGFANVADAPLSSEPPLIDGLPLFTPGIPAITTVEGANLTGRLVSFVDTNPQSPVAVVDGIPVGTDFVANGVEGTASIDWGDGSASLGLVVPYVLNGHQVPGVFSITGSHTYLKVGPAEIKITVTDSGGRSLNLVADVLVAEAPLTEVAPAALSGVEGQPLINVTVATFHDANLFGLPSDYKASIDWGDGTSSSGNIVPSADGTVGDFDVIGSHKYIEVSPDQLSLTGLPYVITLTIDDSAGDVGGYQLIIPDSSASIVDETLAPVPAVITSTFTVGRLLSNVEIGLFTESNPPGPGATQPDTPGDFSVLINWGDGSPLDAVTGSVSIVGGTAGATIFRVNGSHVYTAAPPTPPGFFVVTATVFDADPSHITVGQLDVSLEHSITAEPATANLPEGVPESGEVIATVTDSNPKAKAGDFGVTIQSENPDITASHPQVTLIGGGNSVPTVFAVTADLEGNDLEPSGPERDGGGLLVTITNNSDGYAASVSSQVNLYDPVLIDPGVNVQAVAGTSFQGKVASFSTTDLQATPGEFTAVINWGDGQSSSGTIAKSGTGAFLVLGNHTYAQPGTYAVSTTVSDNEGQSVSDTSTATVSAPAIVAQGVSIAAIPRKKFSGTVATFISPIPATTSEFYAMINWGDGSASSGVIIAGANSPGATEFSVFGSHTYSRRKHASGTVTIVESVGTQTIVPIVTSDRSEQRGNGVPRTAVKRKPHATTPGIVLGSSHPKGPQAKFETRGSVPKEAAIKSGMLAARTRFLEGPVPRPR